MASGRITPSDFVRLTATQPARLFGLANKGRIAPGADADLVLWDPARRTTLTNALMQHVIDYTPYEGMQVTRLACRHYPPGRGGDAGRRGASRTRQRAVPAGCPLRFHPAPRRPARRLRRRGIHLAA